MAQNGGFLADNFSIQNVPNTINSNMQEQYLHYFQPKSNFLHLYPLESHINQYIKVSLNTVVPSNSRSVMTDRGHIYLTGGLEEYSSHIDVISSTHAYSVTTKKFGTLSPMAHGRFSHGICAISNHIYAVSGKTSHTTLTPTCEKYDTINGIWSPMSPCHYPCSRPSLVPFNNDTIFKVGGMDDLGLQLNLETYTICSDTWTRIDLNIYAKFDRSMNTGFNYWLNMGGAQLNERTLMLFGGHNLDGKPMRQSFLVEIDAGIEDCSKGKYKVTNVCKKPMPFEGACQTTQAIVKGGVMFSLLDTRRDYMVVGDQVDVGSMVPVMFDGNCWKRLDG